ncbi:putative methyltransferase [Lates japonicus]|uniref:Methyltransferase n=1 Tax=Lates japonicus TaxID=270547 RepID=A0AAD3RL46_LATJO|nr:putative methyltransferase [Lates japonicus]
MELTAPELFNHLKPDRAREAPLCIWRGGPLLGGADSGSLGYDHQRFLRRPTGAEAWATWPSCFTTGHGAGVRGVSNELNDICKILNVKFRHYQEREIWAVYVDKENLATEWIYWHGGDLLQLPGNCKKRTLMRLSVSLSIRNKLLSTMKASSPDTEVTLVVKYFYWLARANLDQSDCMNPPQPFLAHN